MLKMRLKLKMVMGFGMMLLLIAVLGGTSYWALHSVTGTATAILAVEPDIAEHSARARANVYNLRQYEKDVFINIASPEKRAEYSFTINCLMVLDMAGSRRDGA